MDFDYKPKEKVAEPAPVKDMPAACPNCGCDPASGTRTEPGRCTCCGAKL